MVMSFQPRTLKGTKEKPLRKYSIKEITLSDGTIIGIFEGSRGANPDLDILIKYKDKFTKSVPRTPKHIHWVVDLLVKKQHSPELTIKFIKYLREIYDKIDSFENKDDREKFVIKETTKEKLKPYEELNKYGEYSVEFIGNLIELMIKMEKNTPKDKPAKVFKELIDAMVNEKEIFVIISRATQIGH